MRVVVAKSAGYCFGVRDAVDLAYKTAEEYDEVYMLGDIVHNENVVNDLSKAGAKVVDSLDKVPDDKPILLRAHGSKTSVWDDAKSRNLNIIDAKTYQFCKLRFFIFQKGPEIIHDGI